MKNLGIMLLLLFVCLSAEIVQAAGIEGNIIWEIQEPAPTPQMGRWRDRSPFIATKPLLQDPLICLMLERTDGDQPITNPAIPVTIDNLQFSSRLYSVRVGSKLSLKNNSVYPLTVRLIGMGSPATTLAAKSGSGDIDVTKPGLYTLQADEFSHLQAQILVTEKGQCLSQSGQGSFQLEQVPEGIYKLRLWAGQWIEGESFDLAKQVKMSLSVNVRAKGARVIGFHSTQQVVEVPQPQQPQFIPVPIPPPPPPVQRVAPPVTPRPAPKPAVQAPAKVERPAVAPKPAEPKPEPKEEPKEKEPKKKKKKGGIFKIKVIE